MSLGDTQFHQGDTLWHIKRRTLLRLNNIYPAFTGDFSFKQGDSLWSIERKILGMFDQIPLNFPAPPPVIPPTPGQLKAANFALRVVANGGAPISTPTQTALATYADTQIATGVSPLIISECCFVPDNLIASITPFTVGPGLDPWTNSGFAAGDLSVNGMINNGTKYLNTGVNLVSYFGGNAPQPLGLSIYNVTPLNEIGISMGVGDGVGDLQFFFTFIDGNTYFDCFDAANGRAMGANPLFTGFQSANRISNVRSDIYAASSTFPLASVANDILNAGAGVIPNLPIVIFGFNNLGVITPQMHKRFSYGSIQHGMIQSQVLSHFNAVQALRTTLGGGYV